MTEINIVHFFNYDKDSLATFLHILNENEFKIVIPRKIIEVEPVELIGMVEYDTAAYFGQLLSNMATRFSYYVPCSVGTEPFHFIVTIRDLKAFAELLYVVAQVINPHPFETEFFVDFQVKANIFFDKYYDGDEISRSCGLIAIANELQEPYEEYCVLPVKKRARICTSRFNKYSSASLYTHVLKQRVNDFEIIIPKTTDPALIMYDFLNAAYAGQLLSETVDHFAYFVPAPESWNAFYFHVTVHDFDRFTDTLYLIIQGLNYESYNDEEFAVNASLFLDDAYKENVDCKTWGLHQVALLLLCNQ